jgi:polysaccharide export outer membrane protein
MSGDGTRELLIQAGDVIEVTEGKFSVSGDVLKPGAYPIEENTTLLKAISIAGGFVGYGPSSQVKVLRPKKDGAGNEIIHVNTKDITSGEGTQELFIQTGDAIEVTEGKFSVYGEVIKPGTYPMEENITVLKAISIAGGFTKFGSSNRVKILRPLTNETGYEDYENIVGYETIKVNIKRVMDGNSDEDVLLKQGDIVTVSEGVF